MDTLFGFLSGAGCKVLDDIFDIYGKESVNVYVLELLQTAFTMMILYIILSATNSFIYVYYFCIFIPIVLLPKAYTVEPYWLALTILFCPIIIYKLVTHLKPIKLIVLYFILFFNEWSSMFLTEIGECKLFLKPCQQYFPTLYSYFFEEKDMEISKKKLIVRSMNILLCIVMLLYGNQKVVSLFNIEDNDFISILPITSWFILGYNLISVMNQSYMIFYKGVEKKEGIFELPK
jgi:hypothetical protein